MLWSALHYPVSRIAEKVEIGIISCAVKLFFAFFDIEMANQSAKLTRTVSPTDKFTNLRHEQQLNSNYSTSCGINVARLVESPQAFNQI